MLCQSIFSVLHWCLRKMPFWFAECADGTQIVICVLQTSSSLQGIITSCMCLVHSWNIMVAQEKKAFGTFYQHAIHPEGKISTFFSITLFIFYQHPYRYIVPVTKCTDKVRGKKKILHFFSDFLIFSFWSWIKFTRTEGIMRNKAVCMGLSVLSVPQKYQKGAKEFFNGVF